MTLGDIGVHSPNTDNKQEIDDKMKINDLSKIFKNISLFSCLDTQQIEFLEKHVHIRSYPKNTFVITEGDQTDSLFIVLSGKANAIGYDQNGKQIIFNVFRPNDFFGEMSFIDGEPRCCSVITRERSILAIIQRKDFIHVCVNQPDILLKLTKTLLQKLRKATKQIEDLAFKDVYGRTCKLLFELKNDEGIIKEKMTHLEIAFRIGSSREMVSKIMNELKNGKYITIEKGQIIILKTPPELW